jgi:hypothetical protein
VQKEGFNPMEASILFLRSFLDFERENEAEQRRLSEFAFLLPEIADIVVEHHGSESLSVFGYVLADICLPLSQAIQGADLNPYIILAQLIKIIIPYAQKEGFNPIEVSTSFFWSFLSFGRENQGEQERLTKTVFFVPEAIHYVTLSQGNVNAAVDLIAGLLVKNDEIILPFFGSFESLADLDPYTLATKMLAYGENIRDIRSFFSVLRDRVSEIPFALKEFFDFAASIFEILMETGDTSSLRKSVCLAKDLLRSSVVPRNRIQLHPEDGDENYEFLCQIIHFPESVSVCEDIRDFISKGLFQSELWEIPVYMYEPFGQLLLRFCINEDVVDRFTGFFPCFEGADFATKTRFVRPIGYKLLYLHRAFMLGMEGIIPITEEMILSTGGDPKALGNLLLDSLCGMK